MSRVRASHLVNAVAAFAAVEALVKTSNDPRDMEIWRLCMEARTDLMGPLRMVDPLEVVNDLQPTTTPAK